MGGVAQVCSLSSMMRRLPWNRLIVEFFKTKSSSLHATKLLSTNDTSCHGRQVERVDRATSMKLLSLRDEHVLLGPVERTNISKNPCILDARRD